MAFLTLQLRQLLHGLFALKAPATVVGWIWKAALVLSIEGLLLFRHKHHKADRLREARSVDELRSQEEGKASPGLAVTLLYRVLVYFLLLLAAAVVAERVRAAKTATRRGEVRAKTLLAGLGLIPAWAFKDVVANYIAAMSELTQVNLDPVWAGTVLLFATLAAVVLPAPQAGEVGLCKSTLIQAASSMQLGVAFAMNEIVQGAAGDKWSRLFFQLVYAPVVTVAAILARPPLAQKVQAAQHVLARRLLSFLLGTSGFIVAWAWNLLLAAIYDFVVGSHSSEWLTVLLRSVWAVLMTIAAAGLMLLCQSYTAVQDSSHVSVGAELAMLVAGINVGTAWTDVISATYDAFGAGLWRCWALAGLVTVLAPLAALVAEAKLEAFPREAPIEGSELVDASASEPGGGEDAGDGEGEG